MTVSRADDLRNEALRKIGRNIVEPPEAGACPETVSNRKRLEGPCIRIDKEHTKRGSLMLSDSRWEN